MIYADPQLKALIAVLNAHGPVKLRNRYYVGDPLVVAESLLPVCFVSKDTVTISPEDAADDRHYTAVVLNVVGKFARELNQQAFVQAGTSELYDYCEGRNADYSLKEDTIAHVLRSHEVLDGANKLYVDVDTDLSIEYNISPPSRRGMFSIEALIRTNLRLHSPTPESD